MNLYEFTKKYSQGNGEEAMWKTVAVISEVVEQYVPDSEKHCLMRKMYGVMSNGHYNEDFAREDIAKMYYVDGNGERHHAPYWSDDALLSLYRDNKDKIPEYNQWDWMVVMNMMKSDLCHLLSVWFPGLSEDELNEKYVQASLNWLKDEDNPFGKSKAWGYLNSR